MGLMPLSDAANKIVGVRKIIKRWQMRTISQAYDAWLETLDERKMRTVLPEIGSAVAARPHNGESRASRPDSRPGSKNVVKRSRTPDNKTRAKAAFMPGQARAIRVVNGKMQVETAMSRSDLAQKIAEEK